MYLTTLPTIVRAGQARPGEVIYQNKLKWGMLYPKYWYLREATK